MLHEKIQPVRRTLLLADPPATARLPKGTEVLDDGWRRSVFDPVSLAAFFASRGYRVPARRVAVLLESLPESGETALAEVPDARG